MNSDSSPQNSVDVQRLLAKIGEDTIIKEMMAEDIQRLTEENQFLKDRLSEFETAEVVEEEPKKRGRKPSTA